MPGSLIKANFVYQIQNYGYDDMTVYLTQFKFLKKFSITVSLGKSPISSTSICTGFERGHYAHFLCWGVFLVSKIVSG